SDYVVYYIDAKGAFEKVPVVSSTAKTVTFKTTHFSVYAVCVYDKEAHSDSDFLKTSKEVEAEAAKAAANENTAETEADASAAESTSGYTFTDKSETLYAQQTVNVRDLPDTSGNKIGSFATNDEVVVTGQCNETGWYRISYGGGTAYVSNSYVASEKVAVQQPKNETAASQQSGNGGGGSASAPASNSSPQTLSELLAYGAERGWYPMPYCEDYGDYFVVYYFAGTDGASPATVDGKSNVLAVGDIEFLYGGSGSGPVIIKCTCHDAPLP
ncbi:MAG: SH3 domain-containing protein, partial [Lachnospiraceae bacterium]|nr:SH3 domain-containing protein [Lachnospiraceae bacterium]